MNLTDWRAPASPHQASNWVTTLKDRLITPRIKTLETLGLRIIDSKDVGVILAVIDEIDSCDLRLHDLGTP